MKTESVAIISSVMLPLAAVTAWLGFWQFERLEEKQKLLDEFHNAEVQPLDRALENSPRFARISTTGRFDSERHILLDNKIFNGRAGVHVFTPYHSFSGTTILVNRGWKPLPVDRSRLPEVWTPTVPMALDGIMAPPPEHRQKLGEADQLAIDRWPQLVTYLEIEDAAAALQIGLPDKVVWLSPDHEAGFEGRDWSPAVIGPERHQAYAIQWFALSATVLVIWLVIVVRAMSGNAKEERTQ